MKKLARILSATTIAVGLMAGVASADTVTCGNISNTGPGSTNNITCVDNENNTVSCNNKVVVSNTNNQTATSGGAFTTGNTTSGDANSGNSSNDNNVVVTVGASCAPVATAATTPTPAVGGKGADTPATPVVKAAVLPDTGSNAVTEAIAIGTAVLAAAVVASKFGVAAYRRLALK